MRTEDVGDNNSHCRLKLTGNRTESYCTQFLSCPTELTGLDRTDSTFVPCYPAFMNQNGVL